MMLMGLARAGCVHSLAHPGPLVALRLLVGMLDARGLCLQPRALLPLSISALDWLVQRAESKSAFPHHPKGFAGHGRAGSRGWMGGAGAPLP